MSSAQSQHPKTTHSNQYVNASSTKSKTPTRTLLLAALLTSSANAPGPHTVTTIAPTLSAISLSIIIPGFHLPGIINTLPVPLLTSSLLLGLVINSMIRSTSLLPLILRTRSIHGLTHSRHSAVVTVHTSIILRVATVLSQEPEMSGERCDN